MEKIILVGAGGHCHVVLDALFMQKKYKAAGIIDVKDKVGENVFGVPVIGTDSDLKSHLNKGIKYAFISAGSIGRPELRRRLFGLAGGLGFEFPNIIHPSAVISKFSKMGEGNFISAGVIINAGSGLGSHCIINTAAVIEHDCLIGDFVHIAPQAALSGGVRVGQDTHVGASSSVKQYLKIGRNSIIGMGSIVIDDVEDGVVYCGNPARKIKDNEQL